MIVRLGGLIVRKGGGGISSGPGRGGVLARLRGTGWRWRDQLNVHAIALGNPRWQSPAAGAYNAGMGARQQAEIDTWLSTGGLVITASERAARAIAAAFHRTRQSEGLAAWPAPNIHDWNAFVRSAWQDLTLDARLLLNPIQEQSLWAHIAQSQGAAASTLEGPRHRLAALAIDAHELLCSYAPRLLRESARTAWQQDAAAFSAWLTAFDALCRTQNLLSPARLPLDLIPLLEKPAAVPRPHLLLAGFDRILPVQRAVFNAWGVWNEPVRDQPTAPPSFHHAPDAEAELAACALWCRSQLATNPAARLLVITQDATSRRGQLERAFLKHTGPTPQFEFSLGVPLSQVALARGASLLLRWLSSPLAEHELDWLFHSSQSAADSSEAEALQRAMRLLRQKGLERPEWSLTAFLTQEIRTNQTVAAYLPAPWVARITTAQQQLVTLARTPKSPHAWAEAIPQILQTAGWPGVRPLESAEFQAMQRFERALEAAGSLGFDGRLVSWPNFLSTLARTLDETLFAPESQDAPIQIAGPAESAGLAADAIWFLGASEDAWPARASTHPLLPPEVQREARMPHSTPQLDWDLAEAISTRLAAAAPQVHFSFARQSEGRESRPSRLIVHLAGASTDLPSALRLPPASKPLTETFDDRTTIPHLPGLVEGGAAVLTAQSQCPFKAFATIRLGAKSWDPAAAGLTPSQRGQLLHAVLHGIWRGQPNGLRTLADLQAVPDLPAFVTGHVRRAFSEQITPALRDRMPAGYLELERQRLNHLVTEWLTYESSRQPFQVVATEVDNTVHVAGLTLKLRLDRLDRLIDDTLLVVDYKTGDVKTNLWDQPRPDDVQLPLYASFAIPETELIGGLVFAKLRAQEHTFAGCVGDARGTLLANLGPQNALVKKNDLAENLIDWRICIENLAQDFLIGRAPVDPRDYPRTCENCGLQTLCRIQEPENQARLASDDDLDEEDADD